MKYVAERNLNTKVIFRHDPHCERLQLNLEAFFFFRQVGQDTAEELRNKDFRKDLEEREWQAARERGKEKGSRSSIEQPKRPRLDQPPPSNLDADDPVDDEDEDDSDERCNISDHTYGMNFSSVFNNFSGTRLYFQVQRHHF